MADLSHTHGVPQCTLEQYEKEFSDRHLLHGVIAKWAKEKPNALALIMVETGKTHTYKAFNDRITAYALKLVQMGYKKGDFLATMLPLTEEHIFLEYACFKIGVIHAPLDLRLKPPEVVRSLDLIKAKGFVCLGKTPMADFTSLIRDVKNQCPYLQDIVHFSPLGEPISGVTSAEAMLQDIEALVAQPQQSPVWAQFEKATNAVSELDGAQVIYTTGSTGLPKPALLTHRNITSQNMCLGVGFDMIKGIRMLVNLPPSHVGCQGEQLMTSMFCGGTAVILHLFDAEKSLKAIQDHQVEIIGQIPSMYQLQWRLPHFGQHSLSSLKTAIHGGQQVSRPFLEQLSKMSPQMVTGLGLTEMAGFVTYTPLKATVDDLVDNVGFAMPITPLTIRKPMTLDGKAGEEVPDGEVGEICFSGPQVFVSYVNNDDAYNRTVSQEGICYTGDLGYKSDKGLRFSGRSKLVIKPKGYQVHPAQIESHFAMLVDKVAAAAAVGAPHEVFGEGVILFVEKRPGATLTSEELESHAKGIASYMRPLHYVFLEPGQFPLNRVAKTDYVSLKEKGIGEAKKLKAAGTWD